MSNRLMTLPNFLQVIEAPLQTLRQPISSRAIDSGYFLYNQVLSAFLNDDKPSMRALCRELEIQANQVQTLESVIFFHLAKLRQAISERKVSPEMIQQLLGFMYLPVTELLVAECLFVIARGSEALGKFEDAARYYDKSHLNFKNCGAKKKSAKALLKSLGIQAKVNPSFNSISDYKKLATKALQANDPKSAARALLAVSYELVSEGDFRLALKYVKRALIANSSSPRSIFHMKALIICAYLQLSLGRREEAALTLNNTRTFHHLEIQAAIDYLDSLKLEQQVPNLPELNFQRLLQSWHQYLVINLGREDLDIEILSQSEEYLLAMQGSWPRQNVLLGLLIERFTIIIQKLKEFLLEKSQIFRHR